MPPLPRKSSTNRRRYARQPGPPDPRSMDLQIRRIATHLLRGATQVKSNDRRRYSLRRRSSSVGSEKLASRSPHQSTCNESLQKTQHIAIEKPHASSSNSMLKVEPIVADRQHVPLADSELPENTTAGFKETSARTKPVVRHRGADIHGLSPSPPNISTSSLRSPAQPARTAVGSSCHRPDNINDPVLAQPTGRPGNFKATRGGNSNLPLGTRRSACDQEGTVLSQSLPQPLSAARSQLPIASPHVGPHQPKATLQPPTAAPAVSQRPTTTQLQTDSQSANLTGGVQRQTGNLEDVSGTSRRSQPTVSLSESVNSPPLPLHRDIPDSSTTCLNCNHISSLRVVTTSPTLMPTLTRPETNGGAEVLGELTSPPASTLLSPVPSHFPGSAPKHLHGLNTNHGPASSPADTSPMFSNPEMPPRFRLIHPQPTTSPLTTPPDSPPQPQQLPIVDMPVPNHQTLVKKERLFHDESGSTHQQNLGELGSTWQGCVVP